MRTRPVCSAGGSAQAQIKFDYCSPAGQKGTIDCVCQGVTGCNKDFNPAALNRIAGSYQCCENTLGIPCGSQVSVTYLSGTCGGGCTSGVAPTSTDTCYATQCTWTDGTPPAVDLTTGTMTTSGATSNVTYPTCRAPQPAAADYCPVGGPGIVGHPVDVGTSTSSEDFTDVSLATPLGPVTFRRFYISDGRAWALHASLGRATDPFVPVPFGTSLSAPNALNWWHNFYSFVSQEPPWSRDAVHVRYPSGQVTPLKAPPSWGAPGFLALSDSQIESSRDDTSRVLWNPADGGSFTVVRDQQPRLVYAARHGTGFDGGVARYFLSRIETAEYPGATIASVSYAQPFIGTTPCPGAGSDGVPYINEVTASSGVKLRFRYEGIATFPGSRASFECPISGLELIDTDGGVRRVMDYSNNYVTSQVQFTAGNHDKPGAAHGITWEMLYDSPSAVTYSLAQSSGVGPVWTHTKDATGAIVASSINPPAMSSVTEWSGFQNASYPSPCDAGLPAQACTSQHTLTQGGLMHGDGSWLPSSLTRAMTMRTIGSSGGPQVSAWRDLATDAGEAWSFSSGSTSPAFDRAHQSRSGAWSTRQVVEQTVGNFGMSTFTPPYELREVRTGASDSSGSGATDVRRYEYTYGGVGQATRAYEQLVQAELRPSLLVPGADAGTVWSYDTTSNQLNAVIRTGYSKQWSSSATWDLVNQNIGTFYKRTPVWSCAPFSDSLGRVVEVHGPCFVSGTGATDCATGSTVPVTAYEYYPAGGPNSLMLKSVTRFPNATGPAACGTGLRTQYSNTTASLTACA